MTTFGDIYPHSIYYNFIFNKSEKKCDIYKCKPLDDRIESEHIITLRNNQLKCLKSVRYFFADYISGRSKKQVKLERWANETHVESLLGKAVMPLFLAIEDVDDEDVINKALNKWQTYRPEEMWFINNRIMGDDNWRKAIKIIFQ